MGSGSSPWIAATVVVSVVLGLIIGTRVLGGPTVPSAPDADRSPSRARRLAANPATWLATIVAGVFVNQVLFNVYVIRVHGGDVGFIARYLPPGWFDLPGGNGLPAAIARWFPVPRLLAPTVLRVQAFLELPFVVFGYLTVCRWLDRDLYRRVAGSWLVPAAAVAYTVTFCLVEWGLRNPYTAWDIAARIGAAVVVPPWIAAVRRLDTATSATPRPSAGTLVAFVASVAALGYLVLTVYDTALLYNLGRVGRAVPGALGALAVLAAARACAAVLGRRRGASPDPATGAGIDTLASCLSWFVVLFMPGALAIRYGLAPPSVALVGAALIGLTAAVGGCRQALRRMAAGSARTSPGAVAGWAAQLSVAVLAGGLAAAGALRVAAAAARVRGAAGSAELVLLAAAVVFAVVVCAVCAVFDARRRSDARTVRSW